jgi:hypothetical protein
MLTIALGGSTGFAPSTIVLAAQLPAVGDQGNVGKVYVAGMLGGPGGPSKVDAKIAFYPLDAYEPADNKRRHVRELNNTSYIPEGGRVRDKLESEISAAVNPAIDRFAQIVPEAFSASLANAGYTAQVSPVPSTLDKPVAAGDFGQTLKALPFMQKRGATVAVFMDASEIKMVYEGTLTNPLPKKAEQQKGLFDHLSGLGRSLRNTGADTEGRIKNTPPLTFDGVAKLTYTAHYKVYDVATAQELREGAVGPVTVISAPWQGSWQLPGDSSMGLDPDWSLYRKYIQDPRDKVLPALIDELGKKLNTAFTASFKDWPDLMAASQELKAAK